jgi:hypothetical protein
MDDSTPETPIQPSVNTVRPAEAATQKTPESPTGTPLHSHAPPPPKAKHKTEHCRPDQTPWWKDALHVAEVLAVIAVVVIYNKQLDVMSRQLTEMQDSFKLERPWVGPTERTVKYLHATPKEVSLADLPPTRFLGLIWHFKNGGRTVATRVRAHLELKIGAKEGTVNFIYPEAESCKVGELPNEGSIAIPGFGEAVDVYVPQDVRAKLDRVHKDVELYLVGCIDYSDATRIPKYRTDVREIFDSISSGFIVLDSGNNAR